MVVPIFFPLCSPDLTQHTGYRVCSDVFKHERLEAHTVGDIGDSEGKGQGTLGKT